MYARFKLADSNRECFINPVHVCGVYVDKWDVTMIDTVNGSYGVKATPEEVIRTLETCAAPVFKGADWYRTFQPVDSGSQSGTWPEQVSHEVRDDEDRS